MANTPKGSSPPGENPGANGKRPGPPTIDLKATEIPPDAVRQEPAKAEPVRPEPARPEPARPEPARTEPARPEPVKAEPVRAESAKAGPVKAEPAKADPIPPAAQPAADASSATVGREHPESVPPPSVGDPSSGSQHRPGAAPGALASYWTWPPPWPVATAAGAAAVALVVAGLWIAGPASRGDDPSATFALRLALIESQLRQLGERPAAVADPRVSDLAARLAAAEQAMRRLDDISARLGTSEQALRRQDDIAAKLAATEQATRQLDVIAPRLDAMERAVRTFTERLAAVETTTKSTAERLDTSGAAEKALTERLAAVETAVTPLGERLADLGGRVDQARNVARDADRQATIATEEAAQSRAETTDRTMRIAFVAAVLRTAVERGAPFAGELAALKPLMPPEKLSPLEAFAASGVPGSAALARELSALVPAMLAAVAPSAGDGGLIDRLQQSAGRLVRVRPVSDTPGDDPVTVIGRIEAKAARGDIDAALAEFPRLPEAARAPAAAWIRKAETRRAALDIAGRLAHDAVGALGKTSP